MSGPRTASAGQKYADRLKRCGPAGSAKGVADRREYVRIALDAGWSWPDIAHALGITIQAARAYAPKAVGSA